MVATVAVLVGLLSLAASVARPGFISAFLACPVLLSGGDASASGSPLSIASGEWRCG